MLFNETGNTRPIEMGQRTVPCPFEAIRYVRVYARPDSSGCHYGSTDFLGLMAGYIKILYN